MRLARFAGSKRSQLPRSVYQALVDVLTLAARDYEARHTSFSSTMAGVRGVFDEVLHPVVKVRGHAQLVCSSSHNFFFWSTHRVYYLGPIVGHRHNHGVQKLASIAAQYWQKHPHPTLSGARRGVVSPC